MQLELFATAAPAAPRTWADVGPGDRTTYDVPGSPYAGHWTIRRIENHPNAIHTLIVDLVADDGRTWATWRDRRVAFDEPKEPR